MPRVTIHHLLSFLLISIGLMTTMTLGFVPLINILEVNHMNILFVISYWAPYGVSCAIIGYFIDKIKKNRSKLCLSYVFWGVIIITLINIVPDVTLTFILIILAAIVTAFNTIIAASYTNSYIQMNRRGFYTGIYLGIGWAFVAGSAYLSFVNISLNLVILGGLNIIVGVASSLIFHLKRAKLTWEQQIIIPRTYDVKKNGQIYYFSALVFGIFLGIISFLVGTSGDLWSQSTIPSSFYLDNIKYYYDLVKQFGFGTFLVNFDILIVGAMAVLLCPIFGKLMDKYGRKPIFFLGNLMIPSILILFAFWTNIALIGITVLFYAAVVSIFIVINCNVWSDLASKEKIARFNGYGWSTLGLGGASGFFIGFLITRAEFIAIIDTLVVITVILVSELSIIPFVLMKESLPPPEEMDWRKGIIHLYVISASGIVMSDYSFITQKSSDDADLFSGGVTGISTILKEMIGSYQHLKIIDHEDKKLLFEYGDNFLVTLVAYKDLKILRTKLKTLTTEISAVFWETIANWNGNLDIFAPMKTMIRNHFVEG